MRMARWMCSISLSDGSAVDKISNEKVKAMMGIESISEVMFQGKLNWFGHVGTIKRRAG